MPNAPVRRLGIAIMAVVYSVAVANAQNFENKTIRFVFNFPSGNSPDVLVRQLAPFIAKRLPGNPNVIVENRPGAGGLIGSNYLFNNAAPDGLNIGFLVAVAHQGVVGDKNVKFQPNKFRWLGAISQTQVLLARKKLKISSPRDFLTPAAPLVLAVAGNNNVGSMGNRLFLDMIGAKYRIVSGYVGQGETNLALRRNEVNLSNMGLAGYLATRDIIFKEGIYDAVLQRGEAGAHGNFRRNLQIPEIPTIIEAVQMINPAAIDSIEFNAYKTLVGALAVQFAFVLPPKVDNTHFLLLRQALVHALLDEETKRAIRQKMKLEYDFVDGPTAEKIVARIQQDYVRNPRIRDVLTRLIAEK